MTEFDQFWARQNQTENKEFAEKVWHAAQRALLRTLNNPPYIPKIGDKIEFLSLCHPRTLHQVREVTNVYPTTINCHYIETNYTNTQGEEVGSGGMLGEVKKVVED